MSRWKALVLGLGLLVGLWWLYPHRQSSEDRAAGVVEIFYAGPGGERAVVMQEVIRRFELESVRLHEEDASRPIYRVVSGQSASRDQTADPTRFLVSVAGERPPDVIFFDRFAIAEWAARGGFEPLDAYMARDVAARAAGELDERVQLVTEDRFYEASWEEACYEGKVYGVPISVNTRVLYYNEDLLRRAGLVYEEGEKKGQARPPRTWAELKEYAVRLTERDEDGRLEVVGFSPQYGNSWLYMYGWMNGGEFMSADGRRCTLNDERIVEALAYMREVYDALGPEGKNGYEYVSAFQAGFQTSHLDPFIQGKVAMKIDGSWALTALAAYGRDLRFGVADNPLPEGQIEAGMERLSWAGGLGAGDS